MRERLNHVLIINVYGIRNNGREEQMQPIGFNGGLSEYFIQE